MKVCFEAAGGMKICRICSVPTKISEELKTMLMRKQHP